MLMEPDFLQSLRSFDKDHIPVPVVQKIKPYIANPEFEANKILTVSVPLTRNHRLALCGLSHCLSMLLTHHTKLQCGCDRVDSLLLLMNTI